MKQKFTRILGVAFSILMFVIIGLFAMKDIDFRVYGETQIVDNHFVGYSEAMNGEQLHEVTRLPIASADAPSITVLVHGQSGDASHFSNDEKWAFEYEANSIVDQLSAKMNYSVNLYLAKFDKETTTNQEDFYLRDLNYNKETIGADGFQYTEYPIKKIENVSKHAVIVFESADNEGTHKSVYEELHTLIDKVSYDYLTLTGKIPTVNLISHSRGGLTSMMYATGYRKNSKTDLIEYEIIRDEEGKGTIGDEIGQPEVYTPEEIIHDHPFNVKGLYSMGTPYTGTDLEAIGSLLMGETMDTKSAKNILDATIQQEIHSCWEAAVAKNSSLQLNAIIGKFDVSFLAGLISEEYQAILDFLEEDGINAQIINKLVDNFEEIVAAINLIITAIAAEAIGVNLLISVLLPLPTPLALSFTVTTTLIGLLETARSAVNLATLHASSIKSEIKRNPNRTGGQTSFSFFGAMLNSLFEAIEATDQILSLSNESYDYKTLKNTGDLFIDEKSQAAIGYSNTVRYERTFNYEIIEFANINDEYQLTNRSKASKNFQYNKSVNNVGIPHNLETHDAEIISYITNEISLGVPSCIYEYTVQAGKATIVSCSIPSFYNEPNWSGLELSLASGVNGYEVGGFAEGCFNRCDFIESFEIPQGITIIPENCFERCTRLREVKIPESVAEIGEEAFYHCTELTEIDLPSGLTAMGEKAFYGCSSLSAVTVSAGCSLEEIPLAAFAYCSSLTDVTIPETVEEIGDSAFEYCSNLSEVVIPATVTEIGLSAFEGCGELENVVFEEESELETIGDWAFASCDSLTMLRLPENVGVIAPNTLKWSSQMLLIYVEKSGGEVVGLSTLDLPSLQMIIVPKKSDLAFYQTEETTERVAKKFYYAATDLALITDDTYWYSMDYFLPYEFKTVYVCEDAASLAGYSQQCLDVGEYAGVIFFVRSQGTFAAAQMMQEYFEEYAVPAFVIGNIDTGSVQLPTIVWDKYSMGYNIAQAYKYENCELNGDSWEDWVAQLEWVYQERGYIPAATSDEELRRDACFWMGLADGLGMSVRLFNVEEMLLEIDSFDYGFFDNWLLIEIDSSDWQEFEASSWHFSRFFSIARDSKDVYNSVYWIQSKMDYVDLIVDCVNNEEDIRETLAEWEYSPVELWGELGYFVEGHTFEEFIGLWKEWYPELNVTAWQEYRNRYYNVGEADLTVTEDGYLCRMEQVVERI